MLYAVLLYGALLTPILALPALLLMERLDRWATGAEPRSRRQFRRSPRASPITRGGSRFGSRLGSPASATGEHAPAAQPGRGRSAAGVDVMTSKAGRYSDRPMSRMRVPMLRAIEGGASLTEATEAALASGCPAPRQRLVRETAVCAVASHSTTRTCGLRRSTRSTTDPAGKKHRPLDVRTERRRALWWSNGPRAGVRGPDPRVNLR